VNVEVDPVSYDLRLGQLPSDHVHPAACRNTYVLKHNRLFLSTGSSKLNPFRSQLRIWNGHHAVLIDIKLHLLIVVNDREVMPFSVECLIANGGWNCTGKVLAGRVILHFPPICDEL